MYLTKNSGKALFLKIVVAGDQVEKRGRVVSKVEVGIGCM